MAAPLVDEHMDRRPAPVVPAPTLVLADRLGVQGLMVEHALDYAGCGMPVFPVNSRTNGPAIASAHPKDDPARGICKGECGKVGHGFHDASTDPEVVRDLWRRHPTAGIGVATGHGCDVLDVDHQDWHTGIAGLLPLRVPRSSPMVRSGGGKWHVWFAPTGLGRHIRFVEHCDWLGTDGYVVVPPSGHPSGGTYRWHRPLQMPLPIAPAELVAKVNPPPPARPRIDAIKSIAPVSSHWNPSGLIGKMACAGEGNRNHTLVWAANRIGLDLRDGKAPHHDALAALDRLHTVAARTGLHDREIIGTIESGFRAGLAGKAGKRSDR